MQNRDNRPDLRIGELAKELNLNPKTIRYYEAIGLLDAPPRSSAGHRIYRDAHREGLVFILKAKAIGLSLEEIASILAIRRQSEWPCEQVMALLDTKIAAIDQQRRTLAEFRRELVALRQSATDAATTEIGICPIIEHYPLKDRR